MSGSETKLSSSIVFAALLATVVSVAPASAVAERQHTVLADIVPLLGERVVSYADMLGGAVVEAWRRAAALQAEAMKRERDVDVDIRTSAIARPSAGQPERSAPAGDVFGSVAISFRRLPALAKLEPSYRQMNGAVLEACDDGACPPPQARLTKAMVGLRDASFAEKVRSVNTSVNRYVTYRRDVDNYGTIDHWATPRETLERQAGDCEDYAILKMALLKNLGVPASSMSVVVLRDESRNLFHAVLSLRTNRGHLILDNMRDEVLMDRDLPHYTPLYSLNAGKGFIHGRRSGGSRAIASNIPFDRVAPGEGPPASATAPSKQARLGDG